MALTGLDIQNALVGLLGAQAAAEKTRTKAFFRTVLMFPWTDVGDADKAFLESVVYENLTGGDVRVLQAKATVATTCAIDATHYATGTLAKRDNVGGGATTIGTVDHTTVALTMLQSRALTLTASAVVVANGSIITWAVTKTMNGKATNTAVQYATNVLVGPVDSSFLTVEIEQLG